MDKPTFAVGDLVHVADTYARPTDRGVVYRVTDILKVNIVVEPLGGGRRVKAKPDIFLPAPPDAAPANAGVAYLPPLSPGQLVTVAGPGWRQPPGEFYVILRERPDTKVSLAKLGGDTNGRYWPSVPRALLTLVHADRISIGPPREDTDATAPSG